MKTGDSVAPQLEAYIDKTITSLDRDKMVDLDAVFARALIPFSPLKIVDAYGAAEPAQEDLLRAHPETPTLEAFTRQHGRNRQQIDDIRERIAETKTQRAAIETVLRPIIKFNTDKRNATRITFENYQYFLEGRSFIQRIKDFCSGNHTYARGRRALQKVNKPCADNYTRQLHKLAVVNEDLNFLNGELSCYASAWKKDDRQLERCRTLMENDMPPAQALDLIRKNVKKAFSNCAFVNGFGRLLEKKERPGFYVAARQALACV